MNSRAQDEQNRKVFEEARREWEGLSLEERVQRLIKYGVLTPEGKLAPPNGWPATLPSPYDQPESKAS